MRQSWSVALVPHVAGGGPHAPAAQSSPAAHERPQEPQLDVSADVSTQRPPQADCPIGHTHDPAAQPIPAPQATPHAPQWAGSVSVSTQRSPQSERDTQVGPTTA